MPTYLLRGRTPCVQGTVGIEPLPFASANVGETIMLKHTFDGFQNPELEQYLHQRGKRFVLTAGLRTSTCVLLTTASAMQKGFLVALVEDCCAAQDRAIFESWIRLKTHTDLQSGTADAPTVSRTKEISRHDAARVGDNAGI